MKLTLLATLLCTAVLSKPSQPKPHFVPLTLDQASLALSLGDERHLKAFDLPKSTATPGGSAHHTQSITKPLPPPRELKLILDSL